MSFWDVCFEDGNIISIIAPPKEGKTNVIVDIGDNLIQHGYRILSNIAFMKPENIKPAQDKGWLNPNIKYLPQPEDFKYIPLASTLILEASEIDESIHKGNVVVVDEGGISISSSRALSDPVVQFKFLGYSIRKIGACLVIISQSKGSVVPALRKDLIDYEMDIIRHPSGRRDLHILKSNRYFNTDKGDYDVKFDDYDYLENISQTRLGYDVRHPGGFRWDIDLQEFYNEIALSGYDSIEIRKEIPRIIKNMVAERKIDEFMKKKKFMRTGTVAEFLKVHPNTIRNWADEGKLNCIIDAKGNRLFSRSEITKFAIEMGLI